MIRLQREQYGNMIGLGYYRNKLLHWFNLEGAVACAFHALQAAAGGAGVDRDELLESALFLHDMLRMEFVRPDDTDDRTFLEQTLEGMEQRGVLVASTDGGLTEGDSTILSLLSTIIWPFIDSYWVTISSLFALRRPAGSASRDDLLKRVQWLAETMYHERLIGFYESCSLETLQNAVAQLHKWGVLETQRPVTSSRRKTTPPAGAMLIRLSPQFEKENELEQLAARVAKFRKLPHAVAVGATQPNASGRESQLIAHLPALSKM